MPAFRLSGGTGKWSPRGRYPRAGDRRARRTRSAWQRAADGPLRRPRFPIWSTPRTVAGRCPRPAGGGIRKCLPPNLTGRLFTTSFLVLVYLLRTWLQLPAARLGEHPHRGPSSRRESPVDVRSGPREAGLRRFLSYLARKNLFEQPVLAPVIPKLNAIPIDRGLGKDGIQAVLHAASR